MYTCCPECSTTFRVGPAQLRAAGGRVRCGQCRNVFNAIDHIRVEPAESAEPAASDVSHREEAAALPPIFAKAGLAEQDSAGGYAEDLTATDEWRAIDEPEAAPPAVPAEQAADPESGSRVESLPDANFGDLEEEGLLDAPFADPHAAELAIEEALSAIADEQGDAPLRLDVDSSDANAEGQAVEVTVHEPLVGEPLNDPLDSGGKPDSALDLQELRLEEHLGEDSTEIVVDEVESGDLLAEATALELAVEANEVVERPPETAADLPGDESAVEDFVLEAAAEDSAEPTDDEAAPAASGTDRANADATAVAEASDDTADLDDDIHGATDGAEMEIEAEAETETETEVEAEAEDDPLAQDGPTANEWELGLLEAYAHQADETIDTTPEASTPEKPELLEAELLDDDLDEFLFDDEHGIQEFLEQHRTEVEPADYPTADAPPVATHDAEPSSPIEPTHEQAQAPVHTPTPEPEALTAAIQPPPAPTIIEPNVPDALEREPSPVEDLSVFADFEHAVEAAPESPDENLGAPQPVSASAAAEPLDPEPRTPTATGEADQLHSRAQMAQRLGLLNADSDGAKESGAPDPQPSPGEDEFLVLVDDDTPDAVATGTPFSEVEIDLNAAQPVTQALNPTAAAGDDPLDRPGSEEYTFPLYFEREQATQAMADAEAGFATSEQDDQTALLATEPSDEPADPDATMVMRLPLGDSVEFEVPVDEEDRVTELREVTQEDYSGSDGDGLDLDSDLESAEQAQAASWWRRRRRQLWGGASVALVFALATQLIHYNRESLVINPTIGPWLQSVYQGFGMKLVPPGDLEQYEIRLHVAPAIQGTIQISATLANTADHVQPYPLVRLVLEDRWQEAVGNLIVEPSDYLAQTAGAELMAPKQRVEAQIEVVDPGPTAESYKLDVCLRHSQGALRCADDS